MDKMPRVILNCMPPAHVHMPSPALNILKSVLKQNKIAAEIIYWNIKFEKIHSEWTGLFDVDYYELGRIFPFIHSLAIKYTDQPLKDRIVSFLQLAYERSPKKRKSGKAKYFAGLPDKIHEISRNFIEKEVKAIDFSDVILIGFTSKFYQWIPALQVAEKIKAENPQMKTVIGGFDSKESAMEMIRVFNCFDFAIWGEGEYPLLELVTNLTEGKSDFGNIGGLVFRDSEQIVVSKKKGRKFFDLNQYPKPDYADFFSNAIENKDKGEFLFYILETNRGCDWNRCKFCVLGSGYKYRERDIDSVLEEIDIAIKKYNCGYFQVLDNNVIGSDLARFEMLLEKLTRFFIGSENDFCFFAEIIPYGMDREFYKRLALAGFRMVQIGGESFSDSLIRKMSKKNSFSDNLLGYKSCIKYGIRAEGSNIITGIPGETAKEVNECIANIPFLRFFTGSQLIKFDESPFALEKLSKFYKKMNPKEISLYDAHFIYSFLPEGLKNNMERFDFFSFKKQKKPNAKLWEKFFKILDSYFKASLSYKIFRFENIVIYEEFNNKMKVASLVFDKPEQWEILVVANSRLVSFSDMFETIQKKFRKITTTSLKRMMNELNLNYLLYFDENYNKIVSVIDTDLIL